MADEPKAARDASNWAKPVSELRVGRDLPSDAVNLNVEGKRLSGLAGGFGKMWQKTYRVVLPAGAVTPTELVRVWKERFPDFWPPGNRFYGPLTGIAPGEVAVLNLAAPARTKLSTGIMVLYADEESFSFMNPEGHMFAGMITFSAAEEDGATAVQIQAMIRASDPMYEVAMALGGHRKEDKFWHETLCNLAKAFGIADAEPTMKKVCVDRKRQWRYARNIRRNAAIRSGLYTMAAPVRLIAKPFKRRKQVA